ncbi:MAG: GNAT family N-acetyltransferase [Phycisphaerales bacterium]|nr:MAG: GNAT family N-acetyltransferase [Phycisphaerales bacterium]
MSDEVTYEITRTLDPAELLAFYARQQHETTQDREKLQRMMDNTFCFVAARRGNELIGIARGVTDGVRGQLAECKLDPAFQGPACITRRDGRIEHDHQGIAREMALRVIGALSEYGCERIAALAYGTEVDFCEELGFRRASGIVTLYLDPNAPIPAPVPEGTT